MNIEKLKTNEDLLRVKKYVGNGLKYLFPLAITAVLLDWLFRKVSIHDIVSVVRDGCDYWYVVAMMAITTLSHMIRGIRWGIQLRGAGVPRMPVMRESVSIFGAYALNLVFPRLGEVWRCVYVSRREKVPLSTVVGTDIGDRGSDLIVVLSLFVLSMFVARRAMDTFMVHYAVGREIHHALDDPLMWSVIFAIVGALYSVLHFCRHYKEIARIDDSIEKMWQGFKVIFTMKGRWTYVFLTLGIWLCYFMETYVTFFAFPFTRELITEPGTCGGLIPGLVAFVFGSFSMAVPSNGGLGPWNLAVMFALSLFGISNAEGAAFALVMWGSQAAWLVVLGIFSACYIIWDDKRHPLATATASNSQK